MELSLWGNIASFSVSETKAMFPPKAQGWFLIEVHLVNIFFRQNHPFSFGIQSVSLNSMLSEGGKSLYNIYNSFPPLGIKRFIYEGWKSVIKETELPPSSDPYFFTFSYKYVYSANPIIRLKIAFIKRCWNLHQNAL